MKLLVLSEELKRYGIESYCVNEGTEDFYDVELYHKESCCYEPGVLYVIGVQEFSELDQSNRERTLFGVCIKGKDRAPDKKVFLKNGIFLYTEVSSDAVSRKMEAVLEQEIISAEKTERLCRLFFGKGGIQQALNEGEKILGNPLLLADSGKDVLGCSEGLRDDPALYNQILSSYYNYGVRFLDCISSNLYADGKKIAVLSAIRTRSSFEERDKEFLAMIGKIISGRLQEKEFNRDLQGLKYEYLLLGMLEGRIEDSFFIQKELRKSLHHWRENLFVLTILPKSLSSDTWDLGKVKIHLERLIPGNRTVMYQGKMVLVFSREESFAFSETERIELKRFLKKNALNAGLSRAFKQFEKIREYYLQAFTALELGTRIEQEKGLFLYEDYAAFHMLDVCSRKSDLMEFCHPAVLQLLEYDRENHTDYVHTLFAYLQCEKKWKRATEELHISHSTLLYRLSKIRDIIRDDLEDSGFLYQLMLTMKILFMY